MADGERKRAVLECRVLIYERERQLWEHLWKDDGGLSLWKAGVLCRSAESGVRRRQNPHRRASRPVVVSSQPQIARGVSWAMASSAHTCFSKSAAPLVSSIHTWYGSTVSEQSKPSLPLQPLDLKPMPTILLLLKRRRSTVNMTPAVH